MEDESRDLKGWRMQRVEGLRVEGPCEEGKQAPRDSRAPENGNVRDINNTSHVHSFYHLLNWKLSVQIFFSNKYLK